MIARIWSGESPLWVLLLPALLAVWPGERCYSSALPPRDQARLARPGTGGGGRQPDGGWKRQTPVVIWLVEQLHKRGIRPGVVSRGYGGKAAQYPLVLSPATTTAEAGDEPGTDLPSAARRCRYRQCAVMP